MNLTWLPGFSVPVCQRDPSRRRVQTFPPHSSVAGLADISEDGVFVDGGHGVGVGLIRGARRDAEEAVLRVDGSQFTCRGDGMVCVTDPNLAQSHTPSLTALPWWSNFIQAMSSPTHSTFQPGRVGFIMARLVLPQALGKAAAT